MLFYLKCYYNLTDNRCFVSLIKIFAMDKKINLLAPAGDFSCLMAAIQSKADSIYFGIDNLNMRANSTGNFKIDDLSEISCICKKNKIKAYLTLNTVIYDDDDAKMKSILQAAKNAGIDGIIASDFAVIQSAREIGLKVHISTQANVSNFEAVKFFSKYADVIVLARELTLEKIKSICQKIKDENILGPGGELVQIELFIHGALCVGISGKCYMSLAQYNMSANRGECLQACRRKYRVIEEETGKELIIDNKFVMSPKDLCTISFLDQIIDSGCLVLKIEGRARPAEYVKNVVSCYREALEAIKSKSYTKDKIDKWIEKLSSVFNRGFWHGGYYLGSDLEMWSGCYGSKALKKKTYVGKATNYFSKIKVAEFQIQARDLKVGDEILIIGSKTGIISSKITSLTTDVETSLAKIGQKAAFPISEKVRKNDQLYIIEDNIQ